MYYKAISLDDYQYCSTQPYLSGDYQVDLLLRNHNWAGAVNKSVELSYKVVMNPSRAGLYKGDYWSNEGLELFLTLNYLTDYLPSIENDPAEYITSFIDVWANRDSYHIYENNFESSFKQTEYILSIILENIKRKLIANPNHPDLEKYNWIKSVESIYQLDTKRLAISEEDLYRDHHNMIFLANEEVVIDTNLSLSKLNAMVQYVFNFISEVANIKFKHQDAGEQITILAKASVRGGSSVNKDDYFSLERFDYSLGQTHHAQLEGNFYLSDSDEPLKKADFSSSLHGIGHIMMDHPNDANIAIRGSLFPTDDKWDLDRDYGISDEYRADNGCMSVMAFTKCFYQGIAFHDVLTFMPIDIRYFQYISGKNEITRSDDTTYILASSQTYINEIENPMLPIDLSEQYHQENGKDENNFLIFKQVKHHVIYSLYDAGGINSFDISLAENAKIDLNQGAGHFNVIGDNFFIIAYGVDIHNVIVGAGEIEIKLNDLANIITVPSKGARIKIEGFSNNDQLIFEDTANDILEFSGCIYPYSNAGDNDTELCFI
jgi:hypothetical protein